MTDYELLRGELDIMWHTFDKVSLFLVIGVCGFIICIAAIYILATQIDKLNGNINMLKELLINAKVLRDTDFEDPDEGLQRVQDQV